MNKPHLRLHVHIGLSSGQTYWRVTPFGGLKWHFTAREAIAAIILPPSITKL